MKRFVVALILIAVIVSYSVIAAFALTAGRLMSRV